MKPNMRIVITGGTGFLGRPLANALVDAGHSVTILTRGAPRLDRQPENRIRAVPWTPDGSAGAWASELDGADAVVNLAGESIAATRWTAAQKERILESRRVATRSVAAAIARASRPPSLLLNGSAVGFYGPCGAEVITETANAGDDFLAHVCDVWEKEAQVAASDRTRVVRLRTGLVLEKDGGALPQMLTPFKLGAGGPVGSGRQYWPWIHRADWVALARWIIETPAVSGAVNASAPNPVTNADFARSLGRALHRPAFLPAPAFALRLLLGEMADALLLSGQRAVPRHAEQGGFTFRYRQVDEALGAIFAS
jgi:uncharacterized protein (TIGR01777 family)